MSRGLGKDCGFCEHWARHHKNDLTDMSSIKIYFLEHCEDPGRKEDDYPNLKKTGREVDGQFGEPWQP